MRVTVRAPAVFWRPVPKSEVKVEPPKVKLVVPRLVEVAFMAFKFVRELLVEKRFVEVALPRMALVI